MNTDYISNKIYNFDRENGNFSAEKHIQGFENYLDLFEIDEDDVRIRLFALSLQSKVKS